MVTLRISTFLIENCQCHSEWMIFKWDVLFHFVPAAESSFYFPTWMTQSSLIDHIYILPSLVLSLMGSYGFPKLVQRLNLSPRISGLVLTIVRILNTFWFPTLSTILLSRNCRNGWKTYWSVCKSQEFPICINIEMEIYRVRTQCFLFQEDLCGPGFHSPINHCMRDIFRLFAE